MILIAGWSFPRNSSFDVSTRNLGRPAAIPAMIKTAMTRTARRCRMMACSKPRRSRVRGRTLPDLLTFGGLRRERNAGIKNKERTIAARTPTAVITPNSFCGMKNDERRERKPAAVVSDVMITGPFISSIVLRIAPRFGVPPAISSL